MTSMTEAATGAIGEWHPVASADRVPLGNSISIRVEDQSFALFHTAKGFFAITNRCPHQGAPLAGSAIVGETKARCALHGWLFELDRDRLKGRCDELTRPPVRVVDNQIEIFVEEDKDD
jgi:nitrite reductase/ring-hydroxylating ferredoxin subunit